MGSLYCKKIFESGQIRTLPKVLLVRWAVRSAKVTFLGYLDEIARLLRNPDDWEIKSRTLDNVWYRMCSRSTAAIIED